jgi:hypothetical protein
MTADYGVRSVRRGLSPIQILMLIGLVALVVALGFTVFNYWRNQIAIAKVWTVPGRPCSALSQTALVAAGLKAAPEGDLRGFPDMNIDFDNIRIGRRFGYVSCAEIHDNGGLSLDSHPVCEFTRPGVVTITSAKGVYYFNTGSTAPATVSVQDGVPTCVLASRFRVNRNYLTDPASTNPAAGAN